MSLTSKGIRNVIIAVSCSVILAGGIVTSFWTGAWKRFFSKASLPGNSIVCMIHPQPRGMKTPGLQTGYTYYLLTEFARSIDATIDISICGSGYSCLDSIKTGAIDILAFPYADSLEMDSILVSVPVDSLSVWMVRGDRHKDMRHLNNWIGEYSQSSGHDLTRDLFLREFTPTPSMRDSLSSLSPYDSLFRKYADEMNWDWHMLAAIAYQESMFHIEAESHRGAVGLMQIMPPTAARFKAGNMLDPEESLRVGCEYLSFLYRHYRRRSANESERLKFTFAAYNAGEGRIDQCIEMAASQGADSRFWSEVEGTFDQMEKFNGKETSRYVDRILTLTQRFRRICP